VSPAERRWRHLADRWGAGLAVAALLATPVAGVLLALALHAYALTP
jgi:hypothetical protein